MADVLVKPETIKANPNPVQTNAIKETMRLEQVKTSSGKSRQRTKKARKQIFISYSPDAGYTERKFIVETVKQFKENNLAEDIWFDKDENNTDSPCWFSFRMEAVEKCRAAVLFLSESYFSCPVSLYESKTLVERQKSDPHSVKIYSIVYKLPSNNDIPKIYQQIVAPHIPVVDLTKENIYKLSLAEKTSIVIGGLMTELDKHASIHAPPVPSTPPDTEFTGHYKQKKICQWSASDLQEWLFKLGIKEFYRQSLAENMVDGFLLMSMTDQDMIQHMGIDSRAVRKKIMQQILVTLDKEHKLGDNWHLRARTQKSKVNTVYLVYDPTDVRLAQGLKQDLIKKNVQVINHKDLGQSKEEFLQLNAPLMATASHVLIVMTESSALSPFVFHEVLFGDWLGKKLVTAMFKSTWRTLRPALKAVLGECPAIDFESKMYEESLDVLEHHIKPTRTVPGVVLEQAYLTKMADGIKPLSLTNQQDESEWTPVEVSPPVFISYQWDMQSRVEDIRRILEIQGINCWVDISSTMAGPPHRMLSGISQRSGHYVDSVGGSLQSQIQRIMKAATVVLCCITPKYMQSDNCIKDLTLAETFHKPIIPVMMRFCPWPPEGAPSQVRKILVKHTPIDLSNEKLFKQNIFVLVDKIKRLLGMKQ